MLVSVVVLWRRSPAVRVAAVGGAAAYVLSLGGALVVRTAPGASLTGFPLPERIFTKLPLLSNTIPVRYSLYVALFAGLVLALALDRLHARARAARRTRVAAHPGRLGAGPRRAGRRLPGAGDPVRPARSGGRPGRPRVLQRTGRPAHPGGLGRPPLPYPSTPTPQGQLWQAQADFRFKMPGGYFLVPQPPGRAIAFSPALGYDTDTLTSRTLIALAAGTPPAETPALRAALGAQLRALARADAAGVDGRGGDPAQSVQFLTWLAGAPRSRRVACWSGTATFARPPASQPPGRRPAQAGAHVCWPRPPVGRHHPTTHRHRGSPCTTHRPPSGPPDGKA